MENLNNHLCRLCLSTKNVLRSLFSTFRSQELSNIVREFVRLEIEENDELPKLVCTSCAVKLIRIQKNFELFFASDRTLREQFRGLGKEGQSIRQDQIKNEGLDSTSKNAGTADGSLFEFHGVKQEVPDFEDDVEHNVTSMGLASADLSEQQHYNSNAFNAREDKSNLRMIAEAAKSDPARRTKYAKIECDDVDSGSDDDDKDVILKSEEETSSSESGLVKVLPKKKNKQKSITKESKRGRPRKRKQPSEPVPTLNDHKCYICKTDSLGSKQALIEHLATHLDRIPHTCTECVMETVVLTRVRVLNNHFKMHAQPVKCDYCDRRYSSATGKAYHIQTFHLGGGEPCTVNCEVCGKTCGSQNALKSHMRYHTTKLPCSKCDMVFNHWNKLRRHEQKHGETERYECSVCKKVLITAESYNNHFKMHSQELSYHCHLCPKKFNTSPGLTQHLKVHAKNDKYKPAKSWAEHYTVLSLDPKRLKCNHCDHITHKPTNMISHLHSHFKEFECDQCHNMFATPYLLRDHYTTHTGERPVKCDYCEKTFSARNALRFHLKASHPEWVPQKSGCRRKHPNRQQQDESAGSAAAGSVPV